MILGAIDIGSNAARVLVQEVITEENSVRFNKLKLFRYPIRLGFDAFLHGKISDKRAEQLLKMTKIFKLLMELYEVEDYLAYATSAMREASNGEYLVNVVKEENNLPIEIISGNREATILYHTHFGESMRKERNYIYVDVGGGSTEVSLFPNGTLYKSKSFNVGTIRLLHGLVGDEQLQELQEWIQHETCGNKYWGIGSGGNINSMKSLSKLEREEPMDLAYIKKMYAEILPLSIRERMDKYSFKSDRADVISHALQIYQTAFSAANAQQIFVPKIGLSDGMIRLVASKRHKS